MAWAVLSAPKTTVSRGTAQKMQRYAAGCWNGDYPEYSKINSRTILCKPAKFLRACFFMPILCEFNSQALHIYITNETL